MSPGAYAFTAGQNNGRITSSTDAVLGEAVNYTYDSLQRCSVAACGARCSVRYT
jgi:hypothetical protein